MAEKKESFFWTSYSDLMTSLFFIMLTLFVLVIVLLHKRMEATEKQLQEIKKVEASTRELGKSKNFAYRAEYKKYVLDVRCFFDETKFKLSDLQADTASLHQANCEIQIAGSGDGRYNFGYTGGEGTARFKELDSTLMRERGNKERDNQRFVIHIIPKNIIENAEK